MTATNHCLSGGIIGALLPLPVALPLAFASHFVLDSVPHFGVCEETRARSDRYKKFVVLDTLIALSLGISGVIFHKWTMELAGWAAFWPDLLWVASYVKNKNLIMQPSTGFKRFHINLQREYVWGIFVELALAIMLFPELLKFLTH